MSGTDNFLLRSASSCYVLIVVLNGFGSREAGWEEVIEIPRELPTMAPPCLDGWPRPGPPAGHLSAPRGAGGGGGAPNSAQVIENSQFEKANERK